VRDTGADIAGVRGAACDGGRAGRVAAHRVALLRTLCGPTEAEFHGRQGRDAQLRGIRL
jgi:hypothetical protein